VDKIFKLPLILIKRGVLRSSRHLRKWKIILPSPDQITWLHQISRTDVRGNTPSYRWAEGNAAGCVAGKVAFGVTQGDCRRRSGYDSFNSVVTLGLMEISQYYTDKLAAATNNNSYSDTRVKIWTKGVDRRHLFGSEFPVEPDEPPIRGTELGTIACEMANQGSSGPEPPKKISKKFRPGFKSSKFLLLEKVFFTSQKHNRQNTDAFKSQV
jgi:hypothetical protein